MQNRVALGSPSLQRADHAASSVASTVSVPPGHPGDARLRWIPFESYPTNLSHTEPLIRWLLGRACHVGTCSAHHATVRALRPELKTADSTASPTTTTDHHLRLQTSHVSRPFLVAGIPASSWPGLMKRPPPSHLLYQARFRNVSQAPEKKTRWSYGSRRAVMLEDPLLISLALFIAVQMTALTGNSRGRSGSWNFKSLLRLALDYTKGSP